MNVNDKPNPFQVLGLPTDATRREIVEHGQELHGTAKTEEQELYTWAMEQLLLKSSTRLKYELFEMPDTQYEDRAWDDFAEQHRKNPANLTALVKETAPARLEDFDLAALIRLLLDGMLTISEADITAAVDSSPFLPGYGPPPLEVRDVIFG